MKKLAFSFAFFFLIAMATLSAQSLTDSIAVKNRMGPVFLQHDKVLKPKQMVRIMEPVPNAYGYMEKAKSKFDVGTAIGYVGGALIGWPLGTLVAGGDPEWELAGIGAGLIVVSIPFASSYSRNARQAVGLYNGSLLR